MPHISLPVEGALQVYLLPLAGAVDDAAPPVATEAFDFLDAVDAVAALPTDVTAKLPSIYEPVLS